MHQCQLPETGASPLKDRQKTQYANWVRYVPSGTLYAQLRARGKLIERSIKPEVLWVWMLRPGLVEEQERQRAACAEAVGKGYMGLAEAVAPGSRPTDCLPEASHHQLHCRPRRESATVPGRLVNAIA